VTPEHMDEMPSWFLAETSVIQSRLHIDYSHQKTVSSMPTFSAWMWIPCRLIDGYSTPRHTRCQCLNGIITYHLGNHIIVQSFLVGANDL
jgi:hypothetical protein